MIVHILALTSPAQITPPESPEIEWVEVDTASGLPVIFWNASNSADVAKYTLYYYITDNQGQWYPLPTLDTVNQDVRQYSYAGLPDYGDSLSLTVAAIDTAGTISPFSVPHTTVQLSTLYDSCTKTMTLNWTPYVGWTVVRYDVFLSVDNGPFTFFRNVSGDTLTTKHFFIDENHRYCYFVEAVKADGFRSGSNITCRNVTHALHPRYIDLEYASVDTGGALMINLAFYIDPSGEVNDFQLFRARPGTPVAGQQIFTDVSGNQFTHSDAVVGTDRKYLYKLYSLDVCRNPVTASNIAGNIVLHAEMSGLQSRLHWNYYEQYEAGVKNYLLYRITNGQDEVLINILNPPDSSYTDELGSVTGSSIEDEVCYYVIAEENDSQSLGLKGYSRSNRVCVSVVPEILMANAFTPNGDGFNDEIKPVLTFIPQHYIYQVFDRTGSLVFETTNPETGWDGKIRGGAKAMEGVYIYYVRLTTTSGIAVEQNGQITVFYP